MKTSFRFFLCVTAIITFIVLGNNTASAQLSASVKPGNKVAIQMGALPASTTTAYYELQRSSDNISFRTVAVVFPAEAGQAFAAAYKDDVHGIKTAKVFYRIKLTDGQKENYTESVPVLLNNAPADISK
jgi:hypothetical protein